MPELPEVESIVRELRKKIVGLKITGFWADREKVVRQASGISRFTKEITGKKILTVTRRAKYIVIDIEGDKTIFVHQKISGHLMYGKWKMRDNDWVSLISGPLKEDRQNKYIRLIFFLNSGYQVALSDLRRFGKVVLVKDGDVSNLKEIRDLGPEPLDITARKFISLFAQKRGRLKQVLMDPKFIAGIGNIYSDEILWDSGYQPLTRVENLKDKDLLKIFTSTVKILKKAIRYKGDSMDDYRLPSGEKGGYQNVQNAYHQTGEKCKKNDGGIMQRIKVGGRSAHFCPKHQKLV